MTELFRILYVKIHVISSYSFFNLLDLLYNVKKQKSSFNDIFLLEQATNSFVSSTK